MIYESKKDENILAELVEENEKFKTVMLKYLTGDRVGEEFTITTSTLKRWWKVTDAEKSDDEPEIFHVEVEDSKGKKQKIDLPSDFNIADVDVSKYNFNPPEEEKKIVKIPKQIYEYGKDYFAEFFWADGTLYPHIVDVVDMIVQWGGAVKSYKHCIRLTNGCLLIFCPVKRITDRRKSRIEVCMPEEVGIHIKDASKISLKGAIYKNLSYRLNAFSLEELEVIIKEVVKY